MLRSKGAHHGEENATPRNRVSPPATGSRAANAKLREADVRLAAGEKTKAICRSLGIAEQTDYRWRREGLKVPQKQTKRGRLWFNDGSCIRLRPQHEGHVWSYDCVADQTHDGRAFRMLTVIDEHTRECLATHVQRKLRHDDVLAVLTDLFTQRGAPQHIRSDNDGGTVAPVGPRKPGMSSRHKP